MHDTPPVWDGPAGPLPVIERSEEHALHILCALTSDAVEPSVPFGSPPAPSSRETAMWF